MSDPALGLTMLGLIVVVIMMGFPTAFTLMGLGMLFGFVAFYDPGKHWLDNHVFDLMVQRTYGAMTNETLLSIPLFVLMGYVMERGALVDKMFHSVQLAFRRVPGSLAVATLIICTFWGIASGLVGAVVVLMGVIAMRPMLNAGYDTRLAAGVITAGGTLGILIPPSVMIIVYAAVAGQSVCQGLRGAARSHRVRTARPGLERGMERVRDLPWHQAQAVQRTASAAGRIPGRSRQRWRLRCVLLPSPLPAAGLERADRFQLSCQGVSYVSEHLFRMYPVRTSRQRK